MTFKTCSFRTGTIAMLALAAIGLAACSPEELDIETEYVPNSGSEQYPIEVVKGPMTLNVANHNSLKPSQINAISSFAHTAASTGAPVTVSRPHGASPRLAHEVANLLAQQGVASSAIHMNSYAGTRGGPVKITYSAVRAKTKKCGDWSTDITNTKLNEPMPNLGCAVQSNIAAMVVDPYDFERPTPEDPAYANARVNAVKSLDGAAAASTSSTSTPASTSGTTAAKP